MAVMGKRLGEDWFFSGAFDVFYYISAIFLAFCLVIKINFVYLQAVKGGTISYAVIVNANKL